MNSNDFSSLRWMIGDVDDLIKRGFITNDKYCKRLVQIMYMPAFQPMVNWEVFKVDSNKVTEYFVVKTFWDKNEDEKKLGIISGDFRTNDSVLYTIPTGVEPTIINKKIQVNYDFVESVLSRLKGIKISPFPYMCPFGCDGTSFKLSLKDSWHYIDIGWWENGPQNWLELTEFVKEVILTLDKMS